MSEAAHDPVAAIGLLTEPVRRRLYEHVIAQPSPVDRDAAASATGIGRSLAAFHLDRLVEGGLLEATYRRRSGRSGPGAGRPAKFYLRPVERQVEVSLPARRYRLAAEILAEAVEHAGTETLEGVLDAARATGGSLAADVDPRLPPREALMRLLEANGYEPVDTGDGVVRLRNCPFHALVERHRPMTCSMNLALLGSVAASVPDAGLSATAQPADGYCCVSFVEAS
jgi:predicted ArsR family transcriptional regulator